MAVAIAVGFAGAIPDYETLKVRVADYLDRDDIDDRIPVFIALAEAYFNRELRTPDMEVTAEATVDAGTVALPDDCLELRSIHLAADDYDRELRGSIPLAVTQEYNRLPGTPRKVILEGRSLRLLPSPESASRLVIRYFAKLEPLSIASPSNWLLDRHPDLYLSASLWQAGYQIRDPDLVAEGGIATQNIIESIKMEGVKSRYGGGVLAPSGVTQVRGARC